MLVSVLLLLLGAVEVHELGRLRVRFKAFRREIVLAALFIKSILRVMRRIKGLSLRHTELSRVRFAT